MPTLLATRVANRHWKKDFETRCQRKMSLIKGETTEPSKDFLLKSVVFALVKQYHLASSMHSKSIIQKVLEALSYSCNMQLLHVTYVYTFTSPIFHVPSFFVVIFKQHVISSLINYKKSE